METLVYILRLIGLLIAGLSVLIIVHEFGHFLPARLFGMRVEKFFLFFDWPRKLFSFKKGGTEYGVGMIPLGGYVKISGIVDESMDKEQMREAPKPWEFRSKPVWQRMIVMVGGVTMNVLLAILIYSGLVGLYGETKVSNKAVQKLYVLEGSLGDSLGFESGDKLLTFMGQPIQYFDEVATPGILLEDNAWYEVERSGQRVKITVPNGMINYFAEIQEDPIKASVLMPWVGNRVWVDTTGAAPTAKGLGIRTGDRIVGFQGKEIVTFEQFLRLLTKEKMLLGETEKKTFRFTFSRTGQDSTTTYEVKVPLGKTDQLGLGSADTLATEQKSYGFLGSIGRGTALAFSAVSQNLKGLGKVFSGDADVTKSLSGPVGIAKMWDKATLRGGLRGFLEMMALISMVLALMNILPIPALDGGHLVFLLIEAVTGREPSLRVREVAQQIGMLLLLSLMAFVILNDFFK